MMDSLEHKAATLLAGPTVKLVPKLMNYVYRIGTPGIAEQFGTAEREKAALFLMKHQHKFEYFAVLYVLRQIVKKQAAIEVKASLFENAFRAAFLKEVGAIRLERRKDKGYDPYSSEAKSRYRNMIRILKAGGWYGYSPEGTRKWGVVGVINREDLAPMFRAIKLGIDIYVVGVEYRRALQLSPWVPFNTEVTIRCEKYDIDREMWMELTRGKGKVPTQLTEKESEILGQITLDIRMKMAKLSGLEGKLEMEQPRNAASEAPTKSAAGYN